MGLSAGPGIELQGPAGAAMDAEAPPPAGAHSSSAAKSLGALELETRSGPQGSLQASEEGKSMQGVDDAELEAEAQRHSEIWLGLSAASPAEQPLMHMRARWLLAGGLRLHLFQSQGAITGAFCLAGGAQTHPHARAQSSW